GGTITGAVVAQETGSPLAFATIRAIALDGTTYTAVADANGKYSLEGLVPSTYTLVADAAGRARTLVSNVTLATTDRVAVTISMVAESVITGSVNLAPGGPVGGTLQVEAEPSGNTDPNFIFIKTTQDTNFTINGLPTGTYNLTVSLD